MRFERVYRVRSILENWKRMERMKGRLIFAGLLVGRWMSTDNKCTPVTPGRGTSSVMICSFTYKYLRLSDDASGSLVKASPNG